MSGKWDEARWTCGGAAAAKKFYRSTSAATADDVPDKPVSTLPPRIDKAKKSKRLKPDKWRAAFDKDGKLVGLERVLKSILSGGVDHCIRGEVWEFLLGCYAFDTTSDYRQRLREARRERYKELIELCQRMHVSIGSGSLAYTVGSKVMDVRIMSKESAKKEAKLRVETVNSVAKSRLANLDAEKAEQMAEFNRLQDVSINTSVESSVNCLDTRQDIASISNSNSLLSKEQSVAFSNSVYSVSSTVLDGDEASDFHSNEQETGVLSSSGEQSTNHLHFPERTFLPNNGNMEETKIPKIQENDMATLEVDVLPGQDTDKDKSSDSMATKPTLGQQLRAEASELKGAVGATYASMKDVNSNEERIAEWLWTLHRIVVDVVRTDRHLKFYDDAKNMARMSDILAVYAWIDPATGYCQGMSDLLSPFIVIFENDADAFWCFESLLRRVRQNFQMEGPIGVMKQLEALAKILELTDMHMFKHLALIGADNFLFAFRMLLVLFRRELSFGEALCMWEMMWAADFDQGMPWALEYNCLELLKITPPLNSLQEPYACDNNFTDCGRRQRSPSVSPQVQISPSPGDPVYHFSRSPFCGLKAGNFWPKLNRPKVRTVSSLLGRTGDDELSVFVVAAILILNRVKFFKEAQSMDDAIKMFNDIQMKIQVKNCIRTAIKLRKKYHRKLAKQAALERRTISLWQSNRNI
ncbi:hypothetical protein O6H91_09G109600 [Diphasiastrum complanatum]|uniref:Uncharacterized protein n=2 Tax=Diphasiastrum complanatum TaxID=34168 RepID=A0ACC2CSY5_DIPCM|nr:hypothetical protein O6H91_09G109600 [Diphasiastrum complanatum]KAJ7545156.1 hypothetical protein O6H91_09G109600 [Diphasiastrum complanatum]